MASCSMHVFYVHAYFTQSRSVDVNSLIERSVILSTGFDHLTYVAASNIGMNIVC